MDTHVRILKELIESSDSSRKPGFADLYALGNLIGLDRNDIIRLSRQDKSSGFKAVLARHWRVLLPIVIVITFVVILITYALAGNPPASPFSVYPSGTRYNIVKKGDFNTRRIHS